MASVLIVDALGNATGLLATDAVRPIMGQRSASSDARNANSRKYSRWKVSERWKSSAEPKMSLVEGREIVKDALGEVFHGSATCYLI